MTYKVTVRTENQEVSYTAIGDIDKVINDAYSKFEVCAVTVMVKL